MREWGISPSHNWGGRRTKAPEKEKPARGPMGTALGVGVNKQVEKKKGKRKKYGKWVSLKPERNTPDELKGARGGGSPRATQNISAAYGLRGRKGTPEKFLPGYLRVSGEGPGKRRREERRKTFTFLRQSGLPETRIKGKVVGDYRGIW